MPVYEITCPVHGYQQKQSSIAERRLCAVDGCGNLCEWTPTQAPRIAGAGVAGGDYYPSEPEGYHRAGNRDGNEQQRRMYAIDAQLRHPDDPPITSRADVERLMKQKGIQDVGLVEAGSET